MFVNVSLLSPPLLFFSQPVIAAFTTCLLSTRCASRGLLRSQSRYQAEMRRAGFREEEKELFQEAWEAMLWHELFRVEYVTIRDTVERALATLCSGEDGLSQI